MTKRSHISFKTKLAAALLTLGHVDYEDAKGMTADQIISLYHWDHNILHAIEPNDSFWNLTPVLISAHREKSKRDTAIVAKSKRIRAKEAKHRVSMESVRAASKAVNPTIEAIVADSIARMNYAMRPKRRIPSRPFPKIKRRFANNRGNKI